MGKCCLLLDVLGAVEYYPRPQKICVELEHVISKLYSIPGFRHTWDVSPLGKVLMDEDFVEFVDGVLTKHS